MKTINKIILSAAALGLAACGGSDDAQDNSLQTGSFSLSITDAPVDGATAVVVEFTGIELNGPSGQIQIDFDAPKAIDLLALQGSKSELLAEQGELEAGDYQWMRLKVNALENTIDSYIEFDNGMEQYSLYVPSGANNGLKLNRPFTIAAGGRTDFTIDFDLRKSVNKPSAAGKDYKLRPTLRTVNNLEVGTISGSVAADVITNNACAEGAAVYLFDGLDAEADDIDGVGVEPVTAALVTVDADTGIGSYEIGFVEADLDYSLALTCTANLDDPEVDNLDLTADPIVEEVFFIDQQNVSIAADEVTVADF